MSEQKIVIVSIDTEDGERVLAQIQQAAGPGEWRIVSLLDLHEEVSHWVPSKHPERRVMAVVERGAPGVGTRQTAELTEPAMG